MEARPVQHTCSQCGFQNGPEVRFCGQCGAPVGAPVGAPAQPVPQAATGTGLQKNLAGLLCYVLGWITGLVFYFIEKDSFVRFHAMQSIILFGGLTVARIVFSVLSIGPLFWIMWLLNMVLALAALAAWILLMIKAYQGERFKLPFVGDLAEKYAQ